MPSKRSGKPSALIEPEDRQIPLLGTNTNSLPMWIYDFETLQILNVNDAALAVTNFPRADFMRMTAADLFPKKEAEILIRLQEQIRRTKHVRGLWHLHRRARTPLEVKIFLRLMDQDGRQVMIVSARPDHNGSLEMQILKTRLRLSEFAFSHSLRELLQATLDEAELLTNSQIGFFHFVDTNQSTIFLQMWSTNTIAHKCSAKGIGLHYDIDDAGVWADSIRQRKPIIHNDYVSLIHRKGLPPGHVPVARELVVPVMRDGKVVAILGVGNKPRNYTKKDVSIINLLADLAWDIAERKQAEEALRESEKRYRIVADNTYDWEFWQNTEGRFLYSSPSCEHITGHGPQEFMKDPDLWLRIVHPDDQEFLRFHSQRVRLEQVVDEMEFRIILPDARVRWIGHICQPIYDEQGMYLGTRGSNRDITERKRMENLLQEWASFAHLNPSPVLRFNQDGIVTLANVATFRAFQMDSFTDKTVFELFPLLSPDVVRSIIYEDALSHFEMRISHRDYKFTLRGSRALESGYMYGTDITERKQAEDELRRANESIEAINRVLQQAFEREQRISRIDSLTEIFNRGHFFNLAAHEFAVAKRYQRPLSMIILDLDHFKQVNDRWGHQIGDIILKRVAQIASEQLRGADILARYGGEEFTIILPNSNAREAAVVAERIRSSVAAFHYEIDSNNVGVTISMGVAELLPDIITLDQLVQLADRALYLAKEAGRNRVAVYSR